MSATPILLAASGQPWESQVLQMLEAARMPVLKRCVDLTDLLASAATGQSQIAVLSDQLMGLDADAVMRLLRCDVRPIVIGDQDLRGIGIQDSLSVERIEKLVEVILSTQTIELVVDPVRPDVLPAQEAVGRVVVVHGPNGAPGRSLIATTLASMRAREHPTVLIDADPQAGSVAQSLGILDEVSGLLAAARLANTGGLNQASFARCRRRLGDKLDVLTGLPRADRWTELRAGAMESIIGLAQGVGDVVVDSGFSLEADQDYSRTSGRNQATIDSVACSDQLVLVGSAEPVGLSRLTRCLVGVSDQTSAPIHVVVNRMRDSLGWQRRDVLDLIYTYAAPASVTFVPMDLSGVDRSVVAGRSLVEAGKSPVVKALEPLLQQIMS